MPDFADDIEGTEAPRVTLPDLDAPICEPGCVTVDRAGWVRDHLGNFIGMASEVMPYDIRIDTRTKDNPSGFFSAPSPEFVGTVKDFRGFGPAPRPAHPVFGDVPRGWVPLTLVVDGKENQTCFPVESLLLYWGMGLKLGGSTVRLRRGAMGNEDHSQLLMVAESPAEVSRLIAEAQRG